ncbi:MEDS domain-containing protein [Clostridium sp. WILCCON 0269]|uniref:MEDS domain-containing protein n=1 Tax=Candidatus Clostridium eludens TaxID=3381663 RepID=A0ABW8SGL9_9CLOT
MSENNIFGFHSSFYYFGLEHLVLNMYNYVRDGISKNEKIYVCMAPKVYRELMKYVLDTYECTDIENFSASKIINCYKELRPDEVKLKFSRHIDEINKDGYKAVRFIVQTDYMILSTSREDFLNFNRAMLNIISGLRASFMCLYDFEDYLNAKHTIDDKVILESYKIHPYRLYNGKLQNWYKLSHSK